MMGLVACAAGLAALTAAGVRIFGRIFNPISLFAGMWCLSVITILVGPVVFTPVSLETVGLVMLGQVALAAGVIAGASWSEARTPVPPPTDIAAWRTTLFQLALWTGVLGLGGRLLAVRDLMHSGAFYLLLSSPSDFRELALDNQIGVSGVANLLSSLTFVAGAFAGLYVGLYRRGSGLIILPMIGLLGAFVTDAGRAVFIWGTMLMIALYVIARLLVRDDRFTRREWLRWGGLAVAAVATLAVLRLVRGGNVQRTYESTFALYYGSYRYHPGGIVGVLAINVLSYFTGPIPALSQALEWARGPLTLGGYTFRPLFQYLGSAADYSYRFRSAYVPADFNVFTYLYELMLDFGVAGVVTFNVLLGVAVGYCYSMVRRAGTATAALGLGFGLTFLGYAIFLPITYATSFWVALLASVGGAAIWLRPRTA